MFISIFLNYISNIYKRKHKICRTNKTQSGKRIPFSESRFQNSNWMSWTLIARWWDVVIPSSCSVDLLIRWADNISFSAMRRKCFDAVIITAFCVLWNFRNANIFGTVKPKSSTIFNEIVGRSYFWICNRWKNCKLIWGVWLQNPAFTCIL